mmetsp:Transcript_47600/g.87478  ORF Transcript_47600/g.87478 Transcript_47600/m.87478 type:complete len:428 (+) Transcript_47600:99-1382(+)
MFMLVAACGLLYGLSIASAEPQETCDSDLAAVSLRQLMARQVKTPILSEPQIALHGEYKTAQSHATEVGKLNGILCRNGKWLPELYLLGSVKSATTDLAWALVQNGIPSSVMVGSIPDNDFWNHNISSYDVPFLADKESYFVLQYVQDHNLTWNATDAMALWESYMPDCPATSGYSSERKLFADFTVMNLPMSAYGETSSQGGIQAWGFDATSVQMPLTLERWYGQQLKSRPTFIIMMREPLSQMQSLWYHAQTVYHLQGGVVPRQAVGDVAFDDTFLEQLSHTLDLAEAGTITVWLWYAMFGRQIRDWLRHFEPLQFFMVPMQYFIVLARDEFAASLQERLQYPVAFEVAGPSMNSHPHPKLEEEVPPGSNMRVRFDAFMSGENMLLVQQLHGAYMQGAHLPGFHPEGVNATASEVEAWLTTGWVA